jgi:dTDP-4-dehydrorhamnose 3,5-epimerase
MRVQPLAIPDVLLLVPDRFDDPRGFFSETFHADRFRAAGIEAHFVQDNHVYSRDKNVIRGLHFQIPPHAQGKLVRCARGAIFDVALDIRRSSPTFGKSVNAVLSAENWSQMWVPVGFAHGYCTLEPDSEVIYKTTDYHDRVSERGIAFDDPALKIAWPVNASEAVLKDNDRKLPTLAALEAYFS